MEGPQARRRQKPTFLTFLKLDTQSTTNMSINDIRNNCGTQKQSHDKDNTTQFQLQRKWD